MKTYSLNKEIEDTVKEPKYVRQIAYTTEREKKQTLSQLQLEKLIHFSQQSRGRDKKIEKDIEELNSSINKQDKINIYQTC